MSFKNAARRLEYLLFPPICRVCGERQSIFKATLPQPLCDECSTKWAEQMQELCPQCGEAYVRCRCAPEVLRLSRCDRLIKLARYRGKNADMVERLILRCKDINDRTLLRYLAADLVMPVFRVLREDGVDVGNAVVTYAPRRIGQRLVIGHDQAAALSRALARELGCRRIQAIRRVIGTRQQKELGAKERTENARRSYRLAPHIDLTDQTVLLVDDVCTTGATLTACTELLYTAGAKRVIAVCVAVREKEK